MGDLVMIQIDKEISDRSDRDSPPVRCLVVDPGNVATNIFNHGLGPWKWFQNIMWCGYWLAFYMVSRPIP